MIKRCEVVLVAMRRAHLIAAENMPAYRAQLERLRLRVLTAMR